VELESLDELDDDLSDDFSGDEELVDSELPEDPFDETDELLPDSRLSVR
jgi:hypothetical protein